jgi:hypothetical protein
MPKVTGQRVDAAERDAAALELRAAGLSFRAIGRQLGCGTTTAYKRVSRGLDRIVAEPADRVRALELHRLDQLQAAATATLHARHVLVQGGRPVLDPASGDPYPDHGPTLHAIAALLRIAERRARLLGLDQPTRVDAQVRGEVYSLSAIDEELGRLQVELAALGPPQPPAAEQLPGTPPAAPASTVAPVDVGALVADVLDLALDAARVPTVQREAAYRAAAARLEEVDQP